MKNTQNTLKTHKMAEAVVTPQMEKAAEEMTTILTKGGWDALAKAGFVVGGK